MVLFPNFVCCLYIEASNTYGSAAGKYFETTKTQKLKEKAVAVLEVQKVPSMVTEAKNGIFLKSFSKLFLEKSSL